MENTCNADSSLEEFVAVDDDLRKIGNRVGRNQTTVMRICDRWMQKGTTDRRGPSHPLQCTTSREDRQIVRMAVTDRSVTSQTVAQHISVTHHSVSARTIRRRLQQRGLSARRPLFSLLLTLNHRSRTIESANGVMKEECGRQNGMKLSLLKSHVSVCNTTMVGFESADTVEREDAEQLRYTPPHWSCTGYYGWGGIGYHCRTSLIRIAGTLNNQRYISEVLEPVVLPYLQGLATAVFQQDNA
ncbi:transposable element Tcb1 transposase [Trichonephila clavipes]|uniref:Transposable element Tcb1 transposase n=1 Tax=Trichonephila clavipes TaxID=2585209 RepID=A0A8X6VMU9_TRICX|nr:transposable element Tcb1 transposase [Trichonephila clavipes]